MKEHLAQLHLLPAKLLIMQLFWVANFVQKVSIDIELKGRVVRILTEPILANTSIKKGWLIQKMSEACFWFCDFVYSAYH